MIRAAIAHLWFVTIHPFEDGNGRVARAITDMALAQDEKKGMRLYSLSSQIIKERNAYYAVLVGKLYAFNEEKNLNESQIKVLHRMIEVLPDEYAGGMTNKKYVNITKISTETAKRDLKELVEKDVLLPSEKGGRSTNYQLNKAIL